MSPLDQKLARIVTGGTPRVLDLFAGCGGLSLGFQTAGFEITGFVENDPIAAASHAQNFAPPHPAPGQPHGSPIDITETEPYELEEAHGRGHSGSGLHSFVDVIIGGPPCQAFARVGRAKLREVEEHPEAFRQDPRSNLYLRYIHYVRELHPLAILMENVPDVLNFAGHNIFEEICEVLSEMGYNCAYTLLNAAHYGVPQMRQRAFLIAYAAEVGAEPSFPAPTHWIELPKGYEGSRRVALRPLQANLFSQKPVFYEPAPQPTADLPRAVTAEEALRDLPAIRDHLRGGLRRGARRFVNLIPYPADIELSPYGKLMREWPDYENCEGVRDHVIRSLPRDYAIFQGMRPGDQYPEAHAYAMALFQQRIRETSKSKLTPERIEELKRQIVPPYDPSKFPNKWRKMEADQPARTLLAHLGKDSYSHIHYDSSQARTISVREAARLQSFPDGFTFCGTMNPAFRQIGNAVPPLLAYALANVIARELGRPSHVPAIEEFLYATV